MIHFKRQLSPIMGVVAVALMLSAVWMASAFGEGTAMYEASVGSYGSGNGQFSHPAGVARDAEGNLWVADRDNNRVQKFDETGEYVAQFGSYGSGNGQFDAPKGIAIDAEGNIWVTDSGNGRLQKFDDEGGFIEAVGSPGSGNGNFSGPEAIAIDAEGNIWVADTYNYRVQKLDDEGEFIEVVNPEALGAIEPTGIGVGSGGKVWVTDWAHDRVVALSEAGAFVNQFGSSGSGNGEFSHPDGIDVDSKGNVWVGDEGNNRVQRFNEKGEYLDQFGTGGGDEGEFSFSYPFGIVADPGTFIWVTDSNNNRVQKWSTSPIPFCRAGSASTEENEPLILEAGALDCEGEAPLEYEIVSGPEHGEISGFDSETGVLTYTPDSEFTGLDSFTFKATNGKGSSSVKTFEVAVGEVAVCHDGEDTTVMDQPLILEAGALDCEGEAPLEYEIVSGPEHGEISEFDAETGALTYMPESEFTGLDSFTFRAANGLGPAPAKSFQITVQGWPLCHDGEATVPESEPLLLEAGTLDCEGGAPLEYEIVSGPEHGEISGFDSETGELTYTPEAEFTGYDSFRFRAINGVGPSSTKTFEIEVGEITAGTPTFQFSFGGWGYGEGGFQHPTDVAVDNDGHVFVLDGTLHTVQKFTERGEFIDEFGGYGSGNGDLNHPAALAVDGDGDLWVADSGNDRIEKFGPGGEYLDQFGSSGGGYEGYSAYWEGHGQFNYPGGIAVDAAGNIYVSDSGNHRIQKFDDEGNFLAVWQIEGESAPGESHYADPPRVPNVPAGIAVAPNGDVWYADRANTLAFVSRLSPDLRHIGGGEYSPEAELVHPQALDVDSQGNVWVGDAGHDRIVEFNKRGKYLNSFGKWSGYPGGNFDFGSPFGHFGLDVDDHNRIWIADENNYRVQRWVEHKGQAAVCEERDATTAVDHPLHLTAADLGCEGEASVSYEIISGPEHGEISAFNAETGALTYTPESEYNGADSFNFQASNGLGSSEVMSFSIEVGQAPNCEDLKVSTEVAEPLAVQLDCTGDYAGDAYEILKEPEHGEVSEFDAEEGSLSYVPDPEFRGTDKFTYQRSSWVHNSKATVTVAVCAPPTVEAWGEAVDPETPGLTLRVYAAPDDWLCAGVSSMEVWIDEELVYSESRDCGKAKEGCRGMDLIRDVQLPRKKAVGTHDLLVKAEDEVGRKVQEALPEVELKEEGTILDLAKEAEEEGPKEGKCRQPRQIGEVVVGTYCSETIRPYRSATLYRGLDGDDKIYGTGHTDTLRGDNGKDTIIAGRGSDKIKANGGDDTVIAGSGDDWIWGGGGADVLNGGPGADRIRGEGDDDLVRGGATVDRLFGGGGENTLSYADGVTPGFFLTVGTPPLVPGFPEKHAERGVYVNLADAPLFADNGEAARYGGGSDRIRDNNFQNVIGTPYADLIVGSDDANVIDSGAGTDIVRGGDGTDEIYGGPDQDYLDGGVEGGAEDSIDGGAEDTCLQGTAPPACGTNPETELSPPEEGTILVGVLNAHSPHGESTVYLRGSTKADHVSATWSAGKVMLKIDGGEGIFGEGVGCTVESEGTKAECTGSDLASYLAFGGTGEDKLEVEGFPKTVTVTLLGGDGADRLIGGNTSEDALVDGADTSEDHLKGRNGDDTLFSNKGKDTLMGGGGDDLFVSSSLCDGDQIRGGPDNDNANWAQLVGKEIEAEGYPAKPTDPPYEEVANGVNVRLSSKGSISREGIGCGGPGDATGTITGVENIEGSHGPDVLVGNGGNNVLLGRAGSDVLRGRGGNDSILANNRNPTPEATSDEKRDLDTRLECGSGSRDVLKLDPADRHHFKVSKFKGCETKPKELVQPPANYRLPVGPEEEDERLAGEALDERSIGGIDDAEVAGPAALFRFDETSGTSATNWTRAIESEEEEGEAREESEEELEELEAEELEEEEFEFEEEEEVEGEPALGAYEGGVVLDQAGAMEGSRAIGLDGEDDYVDLSNAWDPGGFVANECGTNVSGYSIEMWVKFDGEASGREELFSRSEGGEGLFLYRSGDGRINFTVGGGLESPTVSSDEPVDDSEWHQVVAVMAQRGEGCASIASRGAITEKELETLVSPEIILYVDGFPYTLGVGFERESIIPEWLEAAHNIVGAKAMGSGFSNWLSGSVDDVAIFGHPLSFGEVEGHLSISDAVEPTAYLEPFPDPEDTDEDGITDSLDNCAEVANPEQEDADVNGIGDACEPEEDSDEDGIVDEVDNCREDPNPLQEDLNENEVGDVCEAIE